MKRKRAIKLLMSSGLDRSNANLYLDTMHAFGLTNYLAVLNRTYEIQTGIYNAILVGSD